MDSKALGDEAEVSNCRIPNVPDVQVVPDVKYLLGSHEVPYDLNVLIYCTF
jgi:hypothetical protein